MSYKNKLVKISKIVLFVFLGIIIALSSFLGIISGIHLFKTKSEYKFLNENGYTNVVSVGKYNLGYSCWGVENGNQSHTLVGLSGLGVYDYSVMLRNVTDNFIEDNLVVFIDRAGYGMSDDTKEKQTLEVVVENYRTALKNLNIQPPYILLPHSLGGVYATQWVNMYPEEIEGVFFIDCSQISEDTDFEMEKVGLWNRLEVTACHIGLQRLVYSSEDIPAPYATDLQRKLTKALSIKHLTSYAVLSEIDNINDNARTAFNNIKTNDIPKIFIDASWSFTTAEEFNNYIDYVDMSLKIAGRKNPYKSFTEDKYEELFKQMKQMVEDILLPYLKKMGNTTYIAIPGDHLIYQHRPDDVTIALKNFLYSLN